MLTLGLMVIGTALVVVASTLTPRHIDPMGMFGLPPVRAVQVGKMRTANCKAARRTATVSQCAASGRRGHAPRQAA